MANTIYASFTDASLAEKAAGALLDHGVRSEDISVIRNHDGSTMGSTHRTTTPHAGSDGDNDLKNAGDAAVGGISSVGNRAAEYADRAAGGVADALGADRAAAGYRSAADMRDRKADMDAADASREMGDSVDMNRPSDYASTQTMGTGIDNPGGSMGGAALNDFSRADNSGYGTTHERVESVNRTDDDTDAAAKHGISTTTAADAGSGAITGTAMGVGLGALAALASLFVPGVGLVLGGGALAAALGGVAATAGAGAVAGGVTGYLKDQGVDEHIATGYGSTIEGGGALVSVHVPSGNVDEAQVRELLDKYGATNVNAYATRGYMA